MESTTPESLNIVYTAYTTASNKGEPIETIIKPMKKTVKEKLMPDKNDDDNTNNKEIVPNGSHQISKIEVPRETKSAAKVSLSCNESEKLLAELLKYKTKMKSKRLYIRKLKNNLQILCAAANKLTSAKENESDSQHLTFSQNKCVGLTEKYEPNVNRIFNLVQENKLLHIKLENIENMIRLGYRELRKIRNEDEEDLSVLAQLRKLIISSTDYYAEYCKEHDKYMLVNQKNTFFKNKIRILEYSANALSEQLNVLKALVGHKQHFVPRTIKSNILNYKAITDGNTMKRYKKCPQIDAIKFTESGDRSGDRYGLIPHLSNIKSLLSDQFDLLINLNSLSEAFLSDNKVMPSYSRF